MCVGNEDIFFVEAKEAYWDGCLEVLIRDESSEYYNVIGAKYTSKGDKINIRTLSIQDALCENPDLPVIVEDTFINKKMQDIVDRWREEAKEVNRHVAELNDDYFKTREKNLKKEKEDGQD